MGTTRLKVRTRSVPTGAAMWVMTGVAPTVERGRGGELLLTWSAEHEDQLRAFLRAKQAMEDLLGVETAR